ncbi:MAG: hypothetical protein HQ575_07680 [Candidatus Omnitrophica bacterium]|nr:hypothetical protein [Candidatus Omnitrophota bacterium]
MKVLDAIKKGFELASKNLNLVFVILAFNLIWNLGTIPFTPETPPAGVGVGAAMSPALAIISIIFVLASIFIQGGVLGAARDIVKTGKLELAKFKDYGAKFYVRLLALALVIVLIIGIIGFLATLIVAASAPTGNAVLIAITTIVALVVGGIGLYLVVLLFLSPYILVVEDISIVQAMKASIDFVRKALLKVVGLGALLVLIGFGVGLIMGIIAGILSLVIKGKFLQVITGVISAGVNGYLSVVVTICLLSYYLAMKSGASSEKSST